MVKKKAFVVIKDYSKDGESGKAILGVYADRKLAVERLQREKRKAIGRGWGKTAYKEGKEPGGRYGCGAEKDDWFSIWKSWEYARLHMTLFIEENYFFE